MKKLKLAACGIDCNECGSYKVTTEHDMQSAELIIDWFKDRGWIGEDDTAEAVVKLAPLCTGCWNVERSNAFLYQHGICVDCHYRNCCVEKGINHCGECNDFPCDSYLHFASGHEGHKKAMEYLLSLKQASKGEKP
ncbi:MAG: DUF3795 domain-containing protein [Oscillospiraceae bacterium]|jgi:hypothetical protein|nr:DUF3795 domain-containing protein [Oscillospiraceae bacterium]